ncbi:kinetochore Sim4 complex subunit FTA2-domain-containing protein [Xylaria scruposa]|nr:kinetochore Sim4 complex subunit FTA2-domain-containing protein [Xylaria scruposa]
MYPDWPRSDADLVPLPRCNGPKLQPFDFGGPQAIEFLKYVGEGLHAHVFKVVIRGQIYALKLFRFVYDDDWIGPAADTDPNDRELNSAFYDYGDPFNCECRAFGRLREAGREELAVRCFGYMLLNEKHERAIAAQFPNVHFNGNIYAPSGDDMRTRFLGRDGRAPPVRGIVKQFGHQFEEEAEQLWPALARKTLRDIKALQQLGIIRIDVAERQMIDDKFSDFSTAITVPHFITTPELNPHLTPAMRSAMELDTFKLAIGDYLEFDEMVYGWNMDYASHGSSRRRRYIDVCAFPGGRGCRLKYQLRNKARENVFTFVDPRRYDWKTGNKKNKRRRQRTRIWMYNCSDSKLVEDLKAPWPMGYTQQWDYKDGFIFPRV